MKNKTIDERFACAGNRAAHTNSTGKRAIDIAALLLLLSAILSSSGCIGLTSAPKPKSSQQSPNPPAAATISVAPGSVSFGSVGIGGSVSQSVTISNGGGSNLTVTQASTTMGGVTITGISLPLDVGAGKQSTFNVVFSPKASGTMSGVVSVLSDASSSPSTVSVSGTGVAATALLNASTSTLSFGNVSVGSSKVLSATLANAGNSSVTVSKVSVSGANYSTSGVSAGLILAPGQTATLDVTFSPLAAGNFPASVTVASNATNSPATISFTGAGTQSVSHSVALTWSPSTSTVAGYNVYRSGVSGGPYSILDSLVVVTDSYTDSTVTAGQIYYYVVTSVTAGGVESADSAQTSATVPTP